MQLKENKLLVTYLALALVILIGGGVGVFLTSLSANKAEKDAQGQVDTVKNMLRGGKKNPLPTTKNVDKLQSQNENGLSELKQLIADLEPYTFDPSGASFPAQVQIGEIQENAITRETFGNFLKDVYELRFGKLQELNVSIPDSFYMGMGEYDSATPESDEVARFLAYQLGAIDSILEVLTNSQVSSLGLIREKTGPELQASDTPAPTSSNSAKSTPKPEQKMEVADTHRLQLTFRSSQQVVQDLLNYLSNTKDYFFIVNSVTINNEMKKAPTVSGVEQQLESLRAAIEEDAAATGEFEVEEFGTDGFGASEGMTEFGDEFEQDEFAAADGFDDQEAPVIAVQVMGDEQLEVSMEIFLITFRPLLPDTETEGETAVSTSN